MPNCSAPNRACTCTFGDVEVAASGADARDTAVCVTPPRSEIGTLELRLRLNGHLHTSLPSLPFVYHAPLAIALVGRIAVADSTAGSPQPAPDR